MTLINTYNKINIRNYKRGELREMASKIYGYARVSTKEQNLERQIQALKEYGIGDRDIITDKASGKDFNRNGYITLKESLLREGDTLVIKELDRLGRNMEQIKEEWRELQKRGIDIVILDNPMLNTKGKEDLEKTLISNIVLEILSYQAQKEREKIKIRQEEGIARAKENNVKFGRPKIEMPKEFEEVYARVKLGEITSVKAMQILGLKKNTYYSFVKEYEGK